MTDNNNDEKESIDKAEFDERIESIEEKEADPAELPALLDFNELLEMREDLTEVNDNLDQTAGYWAQATLVLEEQIEAAEQLGETEKKAALQGTHDKVNELVERIDGGEMLAKMRDELNE
jgi:hypothetical protein